MYNWKYEVSKVGAMRVRLAIPDDISACVAMEPTRFGCVNKWHQGEYVKILQRLLGEGRALLAVVVNDDGMPAAFGLSLFISDELRHRLLLPRAPRAVMGQELLNAYQEESRRGTKRALILRPDAILRAHRGEGLNLLGFYGWRNDLSETDLARVRYLLWESFHTLHQGYHLKWFLKEVYGEQERANYLMMGLRMYSLPAEYAAQWQRYQPYRMGIARAETDLPQMASLLFRAGRPSVSLSARMREAAQLAYLLELDDAQVAECLPAKYNARSAQVSRKEVYTIWSRLHRLLNQAGIGGGGGRGRQACLRYLRLYPETMFPLHIHTLFYRRPDLARRYPLPLRESAVVEVANHAPQQEQNASGRT